MYCEIIFLRWMVYGADYIYDNLRPESCHQFSPLSRIIC
jgi:hypothetical protein